MILSASRWGDEGRGRPARAQHSSTCGADHSAGPRPFESSTLQPIDSQQWGVSFSIKQCHNFDIDPQQTLVWLIQTIGFRRLRLMSYWNEHEKEPGVYDFAALDWQMTMAQQYGCCVTLCLGARQPRWPENHWPTWAWQLSKPERTKALLAYIQHVVERYRTASSIVSYQLENEALLESFGERPEIDRQRLRAEFALVKRLDPDHPIIMTTSDPWGIPMRDPIPDSIGFSYYHIVHTRRGYRSAHHYAWLHWLRSQMIRLIWNRPCFIHELQLEPWGPKAIWQMPIAEQNASMDIARIQRNLQLARHTGLHPIDLWGGEWWYWRLQRLGDPSIWETVASIIQQQKLAGDRG